GATQAILQPQAPDHDECLAHDLARNLRSALKTLREDDRHFDDPHALPPEFVGQFNLKTVAVGADVMKIDRLECGTPETFVSAGGIGEGHTSDDLDIFGGALAQHQSGHRPVDDPNAIAVT